MTKTELFREIYKLYAEGFDYLDRLPDETAATVFENEYTESLELTIDLLMEQVFTEQERLSIDWFMFDWHKDHRLSIRVDGLDYAFNDVDDFIKLLKNKAGWE